MKTITQKLAIGGVNLLALGISAGDASLLIPQMSGTGSNQFQKMSQGDLRSLEASHLEVYAGCKWGKAAFDPIKVENETLSPEVQSLYALMG